MGNIKIVSGRQSSAGSSQIQKAKAHQSRPKSSIVGGGAMLVGKELFNSTAPVKNLVNFEDSSQLRDSLIVIGPNFGQKTNMFATSMRLNSSYLKEEENSKRHHYNSALGGTKEALNSSITTNKKKSFRQKIMNSSYISGSLAPGSATSENVRLKKKKQEQQRSNQKQIGRNSYSNLQHRQTLKAGNGI